jgi:hypothetical protein
MNSESSSSIPRRDFLILPLISLLTVLSMTGLSEFVSRQIWVEKLSDNCTYQDPARGEWRRPNCSTMMKNIEGPWIRYDTNACGFRGTGACGAKPPGLLRVVITGTSAAFGLYVPYEHYFANEAAPQLRDLWGHPVEFQNMGDLGHDWSTEDIVLNQMLALKPDAVLYVLMPFDLNRMDHSQLVQQDDAVTASMKRPWWTWTDVRLKARESRFLFMAQHFMLRDEKFFLHAYGDYADPFDVSRQPTPPVVERRFAQMDRLVGRLAERLHAAGIPLYMLAVPNRVEAALISGNFTVPETDPYVFPNRMEKIAQKHGVGYIDLIPYFKNSPNAENLFYAVDGHPTAGVHRLMSSAVVDYFRNRGGEIESLQTMEKK